MQAQLPSSGTFTDFGGLAAISALGRTDRAAAFDQVGQQFESLFISQILKSMRAANEVFSKDGLFSGWEMQFRQQMFDQQISLSLAQGKGLGLAPFISRQLQRQLPGDNAQNAEEPVVDASWRRQVSAARTGQVTAAMTSAPPAPRPDMPSFAAAANEPTEFASPEEFLTALTPLARRAAGRLGVQPQVLLAQSAHETGWGQAITGNSSGSSRNLFNIKADGDWRGASVTVPTVEYRDGLAVQEKHRFRVYRSFAESFDDFVDFLQGRPRYQLALRDAARPAQFLRGLQDAGYATDPDYADKILTVLDRVQDFWTGR